MFSQAGVAFSQDKVERMHIGYSAQAGAFAPIWITKEAGLFKKNGLDVNLLFIPGGPTAAASMLAGEVQAVAMAGPAVVSSNLGGTDLVMIAGIVNTFAFQVITVTGYSRAFRAAAHGYRSERSDDPATWRTVDPPAGDESGTT